MWLSVLGLLIFTCPGVVFSTRGFTFKHRRLWGTTVLYKAAIFQIVFGFLVVPFFLYFKSDSWGCLRAVKTNVRNPEHAFVHATQPSEVIQSRTTFWSGTNENKTKKPQNKQTVNIQLFQSHPPVGREPSTDNYAGEGVLMLLQYLLLANTLLHCLDQV